MSKIVELPTAKLTPEQMETLRLIRDIERMAKDLGVSPAELFKSMWDKFHEGPAARQQVLDEIRSKQGPQ
jgi:hypothetical protein